MPMRWHWPPEKLPSAVSRRARATGPRGASGRRRPRLLLRAASCRARAGPPRSLSGRHARVERAEGVLEDHRGPAPQSRCRPPVGDVGALEGDAAGRRSGRRPSIARPSVLLPLPDSPTMPERLAALDGQGHAVDRPKPATAEAEPATAGGEKLDAEVVGLEQGARAHATASSTKRQVARRGPAGGERPDRRVDVDAARYAPPATRVEPATGRQRVEGGRLARDRVERAVAARATAGRRAGPRYRDEGGGGAAPPRARTRRRGRHTSRRRCRRSGPRRRGRA